jgi:osmotically-inducible protein OsmY
VGVSWGVARRAEQPFADFMEEGLMLHVRGFVLTLAVALAATSLAGCSETPTRESTGQYVDDAAITTKVKAALVKDQSLAGFQIGVETYKNIVQLSGFVDSPQRAERAQEVAVGVEGVRSVRNNLIVK